MKFSSFSYIHNETDIKPMEYSKQSKELHDLDQ